MSTQDQKLTGLKKRQQIQSANRVMFIWVAVASIAISISIVTSQFFIQKMVYNNKVVSAKSKAASTLKTNIASAKSLKQEVDALVGNQDLTTVRTGEKDSNLKSVLDALPSVLDTTALATSLQHAILNRSGVSIDAISMPPGVIAKASTGTDETKAEPKPIAFSLVMSGSYDKIQNAISDMERTIRPIKIDTMNIEGTDSAMRVSIQATTYWQPAKSTNIKQEAVK